MWSADVGAPAVFARPASANSFGVFTTNAGSLLALDRRTGRLLWKTNLDFLPSGTTVCDEERVMVGLINGDVVAYNLKKKDDQGNESILTAPAKVWNWHIGGPVTTRPLPAERIVVLGGAEGKVYVAFSDERTMIFRFATGGPIGEGFGSYGTRTLIVPSEDQIVYGIDLFTADGLWKYSTGAPVVQAPLTSGEDVIVINSAGGLTNLDPKTGSPRWTSSTHNARLLSLSKSKIYLLSENRDLYVIDRATGTTLLDPIATRQRAGVDLRKLNQTFTNSYNDRMYLGTNSGLIVCIREIGQIQPLLLKDPKALPFGYVPPEGLKLPKPGKSSAEFRVGGEASEPAGDLDQ
jgi:outer membrane protein assembly factor BamB